MVSAEGSDHDSITIPREDADNIPTITLGYIADGQHYVSLSNDEIDFSINQRDVEIENVVLEDGLDDEDVGLHRDYEDGVVQGGNGMVDDEDVGLHRDKEDGIVQGGDCLVDDEDVGLHRDREDGIVQGGDGMVDDEDVGLHRDKEDGIVQGGDGMVDDEDVVLHRDYEDGVVQGGDGMVDDEDVGLHRDKEDGIVQGGDCLVDDEDVGLHRDKEDGIVQGGDGMVDDEDVGLHSDKEDGVVQGGNGMVDNEDVGLHRDKEDGIVQGGDCLVGEENVEKGFVFHVLVDEMGTRNREVEEEEAREGNKKDENLNDEPNICESVCLFAKGACIAALMCTCIASTENEVVDEEKDVYLADISKIIPICGIIRFGDIKKFAGANAGVTLQLQKMLQLMERPVNDRGRRKKIGALQF